MAGLARAAFDAFVWGAIMAPIDILRDGWSTCLRRHHAVPLPTAAECASRTTADWVSSCVDHRLTFLRRPGTQVG